VQTLLSNHVSPSVLPLWQRLALSVLPVIIVAGVGSLLTAPSIPTWYAGLVKPSFSPPNWVFGPAWTLLYALMAYACFRVLNLSKSPERTTALIFFAVQLVLNGLWSPVFFGLHSPFAALMIIGAMWVAIAFTLFSFWKLDKIAGACLVPYLAWVSFASVLNFEIWRLN
jgi:translocator protein